MKILPYNSIMSEEVINFLNNNVGLVATICVIVFTLVISIKVAFTFDFNDWLKQRKETHKRRAQSICPHIYFANLEDSDGKSGKVDINSSLQSPPGTIFWYCSKCGAVLPGVDQEKFQMTCNYYIKHPDQYNKVMKKVDKEISKAL